MLDNDLAKSSGPWLDKQSGHKVGLARSSTRDWLDNFLMHGSIWLQFKRCKQ